MKKLLVLLLIATLAAFVFVGCDLVPPSEGEGEGEGEGEPEGVVVEIENSTKINGIDYVKGGASTITVTFPAPVEGMVTADISDCTATTSATKFLFPNADKTVWTGTIDFDCYSMSVDPCACDSCGTCADAPCCEAVITIISGACETDECIVFPVIVDCEPPEVDLQLKFYDCGDPCDPCGESAGVYFEFTSEFGGDVCNPEGCCGDDCSCVADWNFTTDSECDPCILAEGTDCPVEGETNCECLSYPASGEATYVVTFTIADCVGNEATADLTIVLDTDSIVSVNGEALEFGAIFEFPVSGDCIEEV